MTIQSLPLWIQNFVHDVCPHFIEFQETAVGCHYCYADQTHEVTLFLAATEIVGGAEDGQLTYPPLIVNLLPIIDLFDVVDMASWQSETINADDEVGPNVSIAGRIGENAIWLRVLGKSPARFPAGHSFDASKRNTIQLWTDD